MRVSNVVYCWADVVILARGIIYRRRETQKQCCSVIILLLLCTYIKLFANCSLVRFPVVNIVYVSLRMSVAVTFSRFSWEVGRRVTPLPISNPPPPAIDFVDRQSELQQMWPSSARGFSRLLRSPRPYRQQFASMTDYVIDILLY